MPLCLSKFAVEIDHDYAGSADEGKARSCSILLFNGFIKSSTFKLFVE